VGKGDCTMNVRDRAIGRDVDVRAKECLKCSCYWPRLDPGSFAQGRGYTSRPGHGWLCGTREINGCPPEDQRGLICKSQWGEAMTRKEIVKRLSWLHLLKVSAHTYIGVSPSEVQAIEAAAAILEAGACVCPDCGGDKQIVHVKYDAQIGRTVSVASCCKRCNGTGGIFAAEVKP